MASKEAYGNQEQNFVEVEEGEERTIEQGENDAGRDGVVHVAAQVSGTKRLDFSRDLGTYTRA